MHKKRILTDAQLKYEIEKCEYCEEKPCKVACPANCSPADFIMAAKVNQPSDIRRAVGEILSNNPLGGICGAVCPDKFCVQSCIYSKINEPVDIPSVQATLIAKAKAMKLMPKFDKPKSNGKKVAVIGAGSAGIGSAVHLAQKGYTIDIFDSNDIKGGVCNLIPSERLDQSILQTDIDYILSLGEIKLHNNKKIDNPEELLKNGYDAVIMATGLDESYKMNIPNENLAIAGTEFLKSPKKFNLKGKVAVIGGGAVAVDCATVAKHNGVNVEMFVLEAIDEMPITSEEMSSLLENKIELSNRIRIKSIIAESGKISGVECCKIKLKDGNKFALNNLEDISETDHKRKDIDAVIIAIGSRRSYKFYDNKKIFYAGDCLNGPTTVVESVASGKNTAEKVDAFINGNKSIEIKSEKKSYHSVSGFNKLPVSIEAEFFGRKIISPFLLSAAPPSDGLEQMKKAYEAGWPGGIMKTAFDDLPIHIPSEYMYAFDKDTYANCDNVSDHPLKRVCEEIKTLVKMYPDRLTIASTGGPVTGDDANDKKVWQSNTKKLEEAGAMGIEYSLSCPQGGDGTEGDIVSQNPALTAKIIGWVMETGNKDVPKLFKLTGAVTSIRVIVDAIRPVFKKYPDKKAGITLANTFPTLAFRKGKKTNWEEAVVVGMSGQGVLPISYLTLANVSDMNVAISGNGGPMDYKSAADFLALGVKTVQFCTIVMKYGYHIIDELHSGLSFLMQERNIKSVNELIGIALPKPITDFMELSPVKKISDRNLDLCVSCGNCTRCPYLAIELDADKKPKTDSTKCIGCSICVQKCVSGALFMRDRTKEEIHQH